jgi:pimeloyl-ACP methyl ester carboxylesterase
VRLPWAVRFRASAAKATIPSDNSLTRSLRDRLGGGVAASCIRAGYLCAAPIAREFKPAHSTRGPGREARRAPPRDEADTGGQWHIQHKQTSTPVYLGQAVADIEAVRRANGIDRWIVLGHSWGSDLAVRYALEHPARVESVVGSRDMACTRTAYGLRPTSPLGIWKPTSRFIGSLPFTTLSMRRSAAMECHAALGAAGVRHCLIDGDMLDMSYPKGEAGAPAATSCRHNKYVGALMTAHQ